MQPAETGRQVHARFATIAPRVAPALAAAIDSLGPRRFPDRSDRPLVEFLARAIVGQQLSTRAAGSIWSRVERSAAAADLDVSQWLAVAAPEALRACGISGNKSRALAGIRAAHLAGDLSAERLRGLDHGAVAGQLLPLWGVGQWTCDMTALFYCRCTDVWPETDVTVRNTFSRLIGQRRKTSKWAACFAPERSWLALYMWALADARPD